jgi:hypothetical protein
LAFKEKGPVSFRKLWIYLIVLLVVTGLWVVSEFFIPKKTEGLKPRPFFKNLQTDEIQEIQWLRGTEMVHLKKKKVWEIVQPVSVPADSAVVNKIVQTLSQLSPERQLSLTTGQNLKDFGLDAPRVKILFLNQGKWLEIQVGKTTPVGNDSYIRVSNSPDLFLIQEFIVRDLDQDLSALKEKKVKEGS